MVLGTMVLTLIYQPGVDLAAVRRGWGFVAASAAAAALTAAMLAFWRKADVDRPDPVIPD
ncbi:MAG: hypothetical protein WB777_17025 [Mycobacterium sp.]